MKQENQVYLSLGSNISPEKHLTEAIHELSKKVTIAQIASTWETPPFGGGGGNYLNTAIKIYSTLREEELKEKIIRPIEEKLGRIRTSDKYAPRTIDIDILLNGNKVLEPRIWSLPFLALPMAELIPTLEDPETKTNLAEAIQQPHIAKYAHLRRDIQLAIPTK